MANSGKRSSGSLELGRTLRALRQRSDLSGRELARFSSMSQSRISRIECGLLIPTLQDVETIADVLQLDGSTREGLVSQVERLRATSPIRRREANAPQKRMRDLEELATAVRVALPYAFPALLQTTAYAEEVMRRSGWIEEQAIAMNLVWRLERQAKLYDPARRFQFLILEQVLYMRYGSPAMFIEQLTKLRQFNQFPNIELRVLASEDRPPGMIFGGAVILDHSMLVIETAKGSEFIQARADIDFYLQNFATNWQLARSGGDVDRMLMAAADVIDLEQSPSAMVEAHL